MLGPRTARAYEVRIFSCASLLFAQAAIAIFSLHAEPQESVDDYIRRAQQSLAQERFQEARTAALHALKIDARSVDAECLLGMAEFGLGQFESARKDLEKALELDPKPIPAHRTLGEVYLSQERSSDARRQFELVLRLSPADFESLYGLGLSFLLDHQAGSAESAFEKAAALKPRDPSLLKSMLQAQLALKQESKAAATLTLLDDQFDKQDPRRMELAAMLVHEGAYELAIQQFQRLLEAEPGSSELNYDLALAYHRAGQEDQAALLLRNLLARNETAEFEDLLGDVEQARGNRSRSVGAFRRAAELDSQNEEYRYDFAQALAFSSLLNEAAEAFQKATQDFPGSARLWLGLGATYYLAGNYPRAAGTLLRAADMAPRNPQVYYLLGRAFDAVGADQATIARRFADYLASKPNDAWAEYFYGKILAFHGQQSSPSDLAEARRHLERAISLAPHLAEAHAELGNVFELAGQLEAARRELEKATELDPNSSSAFYKLGEIYRRTGESESAKKALQRFRELKAQQRADQDREAIQGFLKSKTQ